MRRRAQARRFRDRVDAGRALAALLGAYAGRDDVIVLGLPRGGVPVAAEVARTLDAPMDVFLVRKLGVPGREEHALGAIASGGVRVVDRELVASLGIPAEWIEAIEAKELRELERREHEYRGTRPPPDVTGRTVIVVDDGMATGSTMLAAVKALRTDDPARIVVATPVASPEACEVLRPFCDEIVAVVTPRPLYAVGLWYDDFSATSDAEVRALLGQAMPSASAPRLSGLQPVTGDATDFDPLVRRATGRRLVLIGESTHGTHEFYRERAEITKRLIAEAGVTVVAVEADWPDAYRVNRFVRGAGDDRDATEALSGFQRFPGWMWRNRDVVDFVTWLRAWNDALPPGAAKVGFYGLDLYSLHASMEAVITHLDEVDPGAARRARDRYSCFDHFSRDPQIYGYEAQMRGAESCERQVVEELVEMQRKAAEVARPDGRVAEDRQFHAEQNARVVVNAERYYRAMFRGSSESWNLRDEHMTDTLDALVAHLERTRGEAKAVVWEHNSHVGDARATEMGTGGQVTVGQLIRQRHGDAALLVGMTTYTGTVTAASEWGGVAERKHVRPALDGSWETLFHEQDEPCFLLDLASVAVGGRRLQRAIGVLYRPETERRSHYLHARLADQFDLVLHVDETHALEPLDRTSIWETGELPETYPTGL